MRIRSGKSAISNHGNNKVKTGHNKSESKKEQPEEYEQALKTFLNLRNRREKIEIFNKNYEIEKIKNNEKSLNKLRSGARKSTVFHFKEETALSPKVRIFEESRLRVGSIILWIVLHSSQFLFVNQIGKCNANFSSVFIISFTFIIFISFITSGIKVSHL